jgi:UDP-N-acetylmuramyl pentapeptide phosphotransferase/UDP-N-acetylglucosamine-1-phosphate transferase
MYFLISFLATYFAIYLLLPILRKYLIDIPNNRSSHSLKTPSGGGVTFILVSTVFMFINGNYLPIICLPLALIGLLDDILNVNFIIRYFIQYLVALVIIGNSNIFENIGINNEIFPLIFIYLLLAFFITSIINFSNFMDGADGLLGASIIIIFLIDAIKIDSSVLILVGTLLAFLKWNWHPSKLFMGDVGSTFLGAMLIGISLNAESLELSLMTLMPAIPLLLDAAVCVVRRFFAKENIFEAHSLHLFQRLYQSGWSHSKISIYYLLSTSLVGIQVLLNSWALIITSLGTIIVYAFYLDQKVAVPFKTSIVNSKLITKS